MIYNTGGTVSYETSLPLPIVTDYSAQKLLYTLDELEKKAISSNAESFAKYWSDVEKKVHKTRQKAFFVENISNEGNIFMCSALNEDTGVIDFVTKKAKSVLDFEDFETALKSKDKNWVLNTLHYYAIHAKAQAFKIFWKLLQEKTSREAQKSVLLMQKRGNEFFLLARAAANKDKATIEFVINKTRNLFSSNDFLTAARSKNNNWVGFALRSFLVHTKSESVEMFWSLVQENLSKNDQKLIILNGDKNGHNFLMCAVATDDNDTEGEMSRFKIILNIAENVLTPDDFSKAVEAGGESWLVKTLCVFARFADHEAFSLFWSFLIGNLSKRDQKKLFLQKGSDILKSCSRSEKCLTVKFILDTFKDLFESDNVALALKSLNENWVLDTFNHFVLNAETDVFMVFWSFLQEKLSKDDQKSLILLQKNHLGDNVISLCSKSKNKSMIKHIVDIAKDLLSPEDITASLTPGSEHWIFEATTSYALHADGDSFTTFWSFLQENVDKNQQKRIFLYNNSNNENLFINSYSNKSKRTQKKVFDVARSLFDRNDFLKAVEAGNQNWLVETLCFYASCAEFNALKMFWSLLPENLDLKKLFLQKTKKGLTILTNSAINKNAVTVKFILDQASGLFSTSNFAMALKSTHQNWLKDTFFTFVLTERIDIFDLFWSFATKKLCKDDQKLLLLQKNAKEFNVFEVCLENKDKSMIKHVVEIARDLLAPEDFKDAAKCRSENWIVDTLGFYAASADLETFNMYWSLLEEKLNKNEQKKIFKQKNDFGLNTVKASEKNENESTRRRVHNIARFLSQSTCCVC